MASAVSVRDSPGGEATQILYEGTEVMELARSRDHYLISFAPPGEESRRMTGWVYKDAVERWGPADGAASTTSTQACAKGDVHVQSDHDFCAKPCREDGDCQTPATCDGEARLFGAADSAEARYCVRTDGD
jgi:hypothetical protein